MIRFLSRWLAILTLVLLALWPISHLRPLMLCFGRVAVGVQDGWTLIVLTNEPAYLDEDDWWKFASGPRMTRPPDSTWRPHHVWSRLGTGSQGGPTLWRTIGMIYTPIWMIALAGASAFLVTRHFIRPRHLPGHCLHCGYNLTGNTSGVCPECGRPAKAA